MNQAGPISRRASRLGTHHSGADGAGSASLLATDAMLDQVPDPGDALLLTDIRLTDIRDVLARLSPEHRAVLTLRELEGLDEKVVSKMLAAGWHGKVTPAPRPAQLREGVATVTGTWPAADDGAAYYRLNVTGTP